ncbi:MAG: hypothetical protein K8I82_16280 [Anaerolineae bacterium]|nr:hypothetical protein [Anaerolineae bacterium]
MKKLLFFVIVMAVLAVPVSAQDMMAPAVEVSDQVSLDGTVTISKVVSPGAGFLVIHRDEGGELSSVIGAAPVNAGENWNVSVSIDATMATPVLYAMLHEDTGEVGTYEFGTIEGADGPVVVDGAPVSPPFNVQLLHAHDQFVADDNSVSIHTVVTDAPGWIVIHSEQDGRPGPVLGQTQIQAGANADVMVMLEGEATSRLWPMLHVDTGEAGVYEFGTVEGADGPIAINGQVATSAFSTVPSIRASDQLVLHGDGMEMADMAAIVVAESVLSEGPGFLVIHADNNGQFGEVIGSAPVSDGINEDVAVEVDASKLTPVVWPMLHVDTGEVGTYEFGTVEGADGPVAIDGNVVAFPINVAPSFTAAAQALTDGTIKIDSVLMDASGWLVIHSSVDGAPNAPLAVVPLRAGVTRNLVIPIDFATVDGAAANQIFPMLHYDTGEAGVYEFGTVEGADAPASVGGNVVVGPVEIQ